MGKHVEWVTHKGKRILFLNAAGLCDEDYIAAQEDLKQELLKERASSLVMIDATKTEMTPATVKKAKEVAAATKAAGIVDGSSAIAGLTGLQKATVQLFGRGIHCCNTVEEAKEWLVNEENKRSKR